MRKFVISAVLLCIVSSPAAADLPSSILVSDNYANTAGQGDVLKYNASSGAFEGVFIDVPQGWADDILYSPTGDLYLGLGGNLHQGGKIQKYDGQTGAFLSEFNVEPNLFFLAFGPNGDLFGTDFFGQKVQRYNPDNGSYLGEFVTAQSGGLSGPMGLTFGPDNNLYVSSRNTGQILRYNGTTGAFMGVFATPGGNGPQDLQFGPDGNLWVAVGQAGLIKRYNAANGSLLSSWAVPGDTTDGMSMAFSPDNNYVLVSESNSGAVRRLNATTGADLGDFVQSGSGGLIYPTAIVYFPQQVPEPGAFSLMAVGFLLVRHRRRLTDRQPR